MEDKKIEQFTDLLRAIGTVAELSYLFYNELLKTGFNNNQALYLARGFINAVVGNEKG